MRRLTRMLLVGTFGALGCGNEDNERIDRDTTDDIVIGPPATLTCHYCVDVPPGTFTGPSNFYRGRFQVAPDCQDPTPLQGIEGFVTEPTIAIDFARECRITPSDTCESEGQVCAPMPDEGYTTCIHHVGVVACYYPYNFRDEVLVIEGGMPFTFTLCCMAEPVPT